MDYPASMAYLDSLNMMGSHLGLNRIKALLRSMGNPQRRMRCILVGGTSGKGSTSAMLASILQRSGLKVGRFTKPHLHSFSERISVNGVDIGKPDLARAISEARLHAQKLRKQPTFFEVCVASALLHFAKSHVQVAVLEVGLGGRLDATNACDAKVCVITNVSAEHRGILGRTVGEIAFEKAGIIKGRGTAVSAAEGRALAVIKAECRKRGTKLLLHKREFRVSRSRLARPIGKGQKFDLRIQGNKYNGLFTPLLGAHQLTNAACAVAAYERAAGEYGFRVSPHAVRLGLAKTKWPGRFEVMQRKPLVVLDCAKDKKAMDALRSTIAEVFPHRKAIVVMSVSSDKEWKRMVKSIAPAAKCAVACAHKVMGRAVEPAALARQFLRFGVRSEIVRDVKDALRRAKSIAGKDGLVVVTGSVFAVGEARGLYNPRRNERHLNEVPSR